MVLQADKKDQGKRGLLSVGFEGQEPLYKEGDSIPYLDALQIPNRIDRDGELEWILPNRDALDVWLDATDPYREYIARKEDQTYQSLFRGLNILMQAIMGFPVRSNYGGWPLEQLPIPFRAKDIPNIWDKAPWQVQSMAIHSAKKYLEAQMSLRGTK